MCIATEEQPASHDLVESTLTMIQGRLEGIKGVLSDFGSVLGREIERKVKSEPVLCENEPNHNHKAQHRKRAHIKTKSTSRSTSRSTSKSTSISPSTRGVGIVGEVLESVLAAAA